MNQEMRLMASRSALCAAIPLLVLFLGCATTVFKISVSSFAADDKGIPKASRIHVYVDPQDPDLMKREFGKKLEYLLEKQGYLSASPSDADYILFFTYGMAGDTETFTKYVYDPGTPVSSGSSQSTGSAAGDFLSGFAKGVADGSQRMRPQQSQRKVHHRILKLVALDAMALHTGNRRVSWQGDISSTGSSDDLRMVLDYMAIPSVELLGKDTGRKVTYQLDLNDPRVLRMLDQYKQ
jgi:hypothetical protein